MWKRSKWQLVAFGTYFQIGLFLSDCVCGVLFIEHALTAITDPGGVVIDAWPHCACRQPKLSNSAEM